MKKSILLAAVLMALVSLCLVFASCDSGSSDSGDDPTPPPVSTTYTVTFDLNGATGTAPDAQTVEKGGTVTKPDDPISDNHIFVGWYKTKDQITGELSDKWDFANDSVTADITLYAKWTFTPSTIAHILVTVEGFPISNSSMSAPDNAWTAVNGNKCYSYNNDLCFLLATFGLKSIGLSNNVVKSGNDYIYSYEDTLTVTFHMTGDVLTSITFTNESSSFDGTYTPASN